VSLPSESTELTGPRGSAEQGVAVSIACPSCHRLVAADAPCPQCGPAPVSVPPSSAESTVVLPPVPDRTAELEIPMGAGDPEEPEAPPPAWPSLDPAAMAAPAPSTHAAMPEPAPSGYGAAREPWSPAFPGVPEPPPVEYPATRGPTPLMPVEAPKIEAAKGRRGAAVLAGAAALVLIGAAAVAGLRGGGGHQATSRATGAPAARDTVRLSPAGVRVSASSTQHPNGGVSYVPAYTLDGHPETAWNSDGQGAGASLTYTFDSPVDLRSITVLNGYQKVLTGSGGKRVDLFQLNERVRTFKIVTDGGTAVWTLRDVRSPQTLTRAFGTTHTVRLQVLAVYPSQRYKDLAVSDVSFGVASE
jgi:hypothetical protein